MKTGKISIICVVGAGTMGANIAGAFARSGCDVKVMDVDQSRLRNGKYILKRSQKGLIEAKLLTQRKADSAMRRITWTTDLKKACQTHYSCDASH